jgi:hypothetical protein
VWLAGNDCPPSLPDDDETLVGQYGQRVLQRRCPDPLPGSQFSNRGKLISS